MRARPLALRSPGRVDVCPRRSRAWPSRSVLASGPLRSRVVDLSAAEIRVLGCLLEKQRTTPDQYPLTLNSLGLACNQATTREPVVEYNEAFIREALHGLGRRGYIRFAGGHNT